MTPELAPGAVISIDADGRIGDYSGPARLNLWPIVRGRNPALARMVCHNLRETTPPLVLRANPLVEARMRACLRHLGIVA